MARTRWDPGKFGGHVTPKFAEKLWLFMNRKDSIARMEAASDLGRAAVEPLSELLPAEFGDAVYDNRVTQVIGSMAKQVMERDGRFVQGPPHRIRFGDLFSAGSRYRRIRLE